MVISSSWGADKCFDGFENFELNRRVISAMMNEDNVFVDIAKQFSLFIQCLNDPIGIKKEDVIILKRLHMRKIGILQNKPKGKDPCSK